MPRARCWSIGCLVARVPAGPARRAAALGWLVEVCAARACWRAFAASALLLSINWLTYIWAVNNDHVVDASLGYFITPLVNVRSAITVLHERLRRSSGSRSPSPTLGVLWLTFQAGQLPWIALVLALELRRLRPAAQDRALGALEGLTLETMVLLPAALAALSGTCRRAAAPASRRRRRDQPVAARLGPLTAVPLLLFAAGARRLPMTTLGLLQYLARPSSS